jgi:hypothetical protein
MTTPFRRALPGAAILCLLGLAACVEPDRTGRLTHVVCHSGGVKVVDDFGTDAHLDGGGLYYESRTTEGRVRATGDCVAFGDFRPSDWKPVLPGMSQRVQQ